MKPYSILIHASGPCGEGTEQSADIALQGLLKQLETAGHKFESVSMVIDGSALPIIGQLKEHPAVDKPSEGVTLASLSKQIASLDSKLGRFAAYEKKDDALRSSENEVKQKFTRASRTKKEGAAAEGGQSEGGAATNDQSQEAAADAGDGTGASESAQTSGATGDAATTTTEAPKNEGAAA